MGMRTRLIAGAVAAGTAILAFAAVIAPAAQADTMPNWTTPLGQHVRFCGDSGKPSYMGVSAGMHTTCPFAKSVARAVLSHSNQRYVSVYSQAAKRTILLRVRSVDTDDGSYLQAAGKTGALVLVTS
jgi:hypothetical protein